MDANPRLAAHRGTRTAPLPLDPQLDCRDNLIDEFAEYLGHPVDGGREHDPASTAVLGDECSVEHPDDLALRRAFVDGECVSAHLEAIECALAHRAHTVLEVGSGVGSLGIRFAQHGLEVTLAALDPALINFARWRFQRRGLSAHFLPAGLESLPEAAFDFVSAVDVLQHLSAPLPVLRSLANALRPGGTLFVHLASDEERARPVRPGRDKDMLLRTLDDAGLWLESVNGSSLVFRRGHAPRYALNPALVLHPTQEGWLLTSERPLRAIRLNQRAGELLTNLQGGRSVSEVAGELGMSLLKVFAFLEDLAKRGIVVRSANTPPARWPAATVVVPARDRPSATRACVESLLRLDYPSDRLEIIVVDDASASPLSEALSDMPIRVLRLETNIGQSAARNRAIREATGEIIAFTDNDCVVEADWLRSLVVHLCNPGTAIVGGRVLSSPPDNAVTAFEAVRSPLDMGMTGGPVSPRASVAYLPSCNLAADRETLQRLRGFSPDMLLGEDADLVWRALRDGYGVHYEPRASIVHHHRSRLIPFLLRRADYGSSEADLQQRHPEARRPLILPVVGIIALAALPMLAVAWQASAALLTLAALMLVGEVIIKWRRLYRAGVRLSAQTIIAAVVRQEGAGLYHLGANVSRYYSLPLVALSIIWPVLLLPLLVLLAIPPVIDYWRLRPEMTLPGFIALYWLEMAAYQIGVWRGCLARRTIGPFVPTPLLTAAGRP